MSNELDVPHVRALIRLALEEDEARNDITSHLTVPEGSKAVGTIRAKEDLVLCGIDLVPLIIGEFGGAIEFEALVKEGALAKSGTDVGRLRGGTRDVLALERTILNFLQRLSGVATHTRSIVEKAPKGLAVYDTRKTTPGWRVLEKYATRIGGATNHRRTLGDMVLIKNNHVDARGGDLEGAIRAALKNKPSAIPLEAEVRDLKELEQAICAGADKVMLDNFSDASIVEAMSFIRGKGVSPFIEVSGGVTPERLTKLGSFGVNAVSLGSLTTAARNVDISMKVEIAGERA